MNMPYKGANPKIVHRKFPALPVVSAGWPPIDLLLTLCRCQEHHERLAIATNAVMAVVMGWYAHLQRKSHSHLPVSCRGYVLVLTLCCNQNSGATQSNCSFVDRIVLCCVVLCVVIMCCNPRCINIGLL
jgi:hypothetical protein